MGSVPGLRSSVRSRVAGEHRRITVLGSTGSIGCSTLDLVARNRQRFTVEALIGNRNVERLAQQAVAVGAGLAVTADPTCYQALKAALAGTDVAVAAGPEAVVDAARRPADLVMAAIVGAAGLAPTLAAAETGAAIALANKECLVSAGELFMRTAQRAGASVVPVDSEHSAVFQVLETRNAEQIERIILTASGGPFRTYSREQIREVTPAQALKHPNWSMGPKVTIDSATLMNKGLELIEAFHLFPVELEQLHVLVHPQSIVHSLVAYRDGSVLAQMGMPDMRTPIAYALAWPRRMEAPVARLRLEEVGQLTFEAVDHARFPAVALCRNCLARSGNATTLLNAANEVAVALFLAGGIAFTGITGLVEATLARAERDGAFGPHQGLDHVLASDAYGRRIAGELAQGLQS